MSPPTTTTRKRYCLAAFKTGHPLVIAYVVKYDAAKLPSTEEMHRRVMALQERFPLLHARIVGEKTRTPTFEIVEPWEPSRLVHHADLAEGDDEETILRKQLAHAEHVDYLSSPLWSVTMHSSPGSPHAYLSLYNNHFVMDGRGSLRCLRALTEADGPETLAAETPDVALYDDTIGQRPGVYLFLTTLYRELIVPNLPISLQRYLCPEMWPGEQPTPESAAWDISLASVPADIVAQLKLKAKAHGVATLHPVVHIAYCAAVWSVFNTNDEPLHFVASAPKSDRNPSAGHSAMTDVYVTLLHDHRTIRAEDAFWPVVAEAATHLTSPDTLSGARQLFGLMRWLPDPPPGADGVTGWEKYLIGRAASVAPYFESLMVSNLGRIDLPPGAQDVVWGQLNHPSALGLAGSLIGHEGGFRLSTQWYEGIPATREQMDRVHRTWEKILERAAKGEEGTMKEITA